MKMKLLIPAILLTLALVIGFMVKSNNTKNIEANLPEKGIVKSENKGEEMGDFLKGESRLGRAMKKSSEETTGGKKFYETGKE